MNSPRQFAPSHKPQAEIQARPKARPEHREGQMQIAQFFLGNQGVLRRMEAGLRISAANDPAEQEADRVADAVMSGREQPHAVAARTSTSAAPVQRKCAQCEEEEPTQVQRKEASSGIPPAAAPPIVRQALSSPGQPLDRTTRGYMERRFGHDFSAVRVHTGDIAAVSARAVNARAFTVGRDIVFDAAAYDPQTVGGKRLLAHELTHVVQQAAGAEPHIQRSLAGCQELLKDPSLATFLPGRVIHRILDAHFRSTVQGATKIAIPGGSAAPLRTQGLCGEDDTVITPQTGGGRAGVGMPDLARRIGGGIVEVAEIKPASIPCLIDGEQQLLRYTENGNALDPPQVAWRAAQSVTAVAPMRESAYRPPVLNIVLPGAGTLELKTAWCSPGLLAYSLKRQGQREQVKVPRREEERQRQLAPVPQGQRSPVTSPVLSPSTYDLVKQFVEEVIASGAQADQAAARFLQAHPEIVGVIILAGVAAIVALLADDVTIAGIVDDVAIPPIILALIRAAQMVPAR